MAITLPVLAAGHMPRLVDNADLLSNSEESTLLAKDFGMHLIISFVIGLVAAVVATNIMKAEAENFSKMSEK